MNTYLSVDGEVPHFEFIPKRSSDRRVALGLAGMVVVIFSVAALPWVLNVNKKAESPVEKILRQYDSNKDGVLDRNELDNLLKNYQIK